MSQNNGVALGYINDGQTRQGYVEAVERLHPAVRFEFRPTLSAERDTIMQKVSDGTTVEATEVSAALVAKRIVNWDLRMYGADGELVTVPLTVEHTRRVQPLLMVKLYTIILGNRAPDADLGNEPDPEKSARDLEAALTGQPPEDSQAGREGN